MFRIRNWMNLLNNASSPLTRRAREIALSAIEEALKSVDPRGLIKSKITLSDDLLEVNGLRFKLSGFRRIFVIGGGKASGSMAEALEEVLKNRIEDGVVVIPRGTSSQYRTRRIRLYEASHPVPDENSVRGALEIMELAGKAGSDDLIICLISGGGSSLMTIPRQGVSLDDKRRITEMLLRSGANINEINTIRKHLSNFKGGMLAKEAYPATLVSLILSDVVGDRLDVIASGPTVPDPTTFIEAINILKRYNLWDKAPASIRDVLTNGVKGLIPETPKPGDKVFEKVHNIIIGNNRLACLSAIKKLQHQGLNTLFLTSFMEGEARNMGLILSSIAFEVLTSGNPIPKPAAIVLGGETTVTVTGSGIGGRNQEIALSASTRIRGVNGVAIAAISTDGIDGPTDAAGAIIDGETGIRAENLGLNMMDYLINNDSYTFFSRIGDLIFTGPTGTNVNDIAIIVVI
ncbi:MAG: glycerate kinase [Candidatus Methanomethylicia archaeon]